MRRTSVDLPDSDEPIVISAQRPAPRPGHPRMTAAPLPAVTYAIGDVHGCLHQLLELEGRIVADAEAFPGQKLIVMLGDYVDRGPASAGVLAHVMARPPDGFQRVCLAGNHEEFMLRALTESRQRASWFSFGGIETLESYGMPCEAGMDLGGAAFERALSAAVPDAHIDWMLGLPSSLVVGGYLFVHAGIRPGVPLHEQSDRDLLWIRNEFLDSDVHFEPTVVHGHTPSVRPVLRPGRIGIDTGCYMTGRLTAVRLVPGAPPHFLAVGPAGSD